MDSALLQMDVQLVEKKITERASLKGDANSDWERADKISKGGWGQDALLVAEAMANDGARQATGGIELIDTSSTKCPCAARWRMASPSGVEPLPAGLRLSRQRASIW